MAGTLFIVEDEAEVRRVLVEYFSGLGYGIVSAGSGHEALAKLQASPAPVDVAVVDWTLPDGSASHVLQAIRERHPDCRIIVTTGHASDVVAEPAPGARPDRVVRKPFTLRALALHVEQMQEKARYDG